VKIKVIQIALLCLLLFSQIADAFACQSLPCKQKASSDVVMIDHSSHDMTNSISENLESICECCQQQCNCPPSMITIAVMLENDIVKPLDLTTFKLPDFTTRIVSTVLALDQRPPKHPIS
jgi:translation initiation factor RLI1